MNIASNPWSFVPADIDTAAITTVALNSDGTVTLTCSGSPGTPFVANQGITIVGVTNTKYIGFYDVITATSSTVYQLAPQFSIPSGTASSGSGNVYLCQYPSTVRIEDISWQGYSTSASVLIYDRNGNILWTASSALAASNAQNRGKLFWVQGFTLATLSAGSTILVTVN